jgi:hypothetical protein
MIRWTPSETKLLARKFLEARIRDMMAPITEVLTKAQEEAFPPERRRDVKAFSLLSWEAQNDIKQELKKFEQRYFEPPIAAAPVSPQPAEVAPQPPPKAEPVSQPVQAARDPLIIEFRVPKAEKPDINKILSEIPTPMLYGYALERLMRGGLPTLPTVPRPDVIRVEATVPTVEPSPAPVVLKADSVEDPTPAEDGRRRVLVYGLLPTAQQIVQQKAKNFLRLDPTFYDANQRTVPAVVTDYVVVASGIVTQFQLDQIKKRFASKDRVFQCDTTDSVLSKLADINSLS